MWFKSEAFSMNNTWTSFLEFCFCDPHSLEGWQWWENWSTNPYEEFSLLRGNHFNFHCWWSQSCNLFAQSLWNTWEHGCSTTHDNVVVQIFSDVYVTFKNWLICDFMETWHLLSNHHWFEKSLCASESLTTDGDCLSVWEFVDFIVLVSSLIS